MFLAPSDFSRFAKSSSFSALIRATKHRDPFARHMLFEALHYWSPRLEPRETAGKSLALVIVHLKPPATSRVAIFPLPLHTVQVGLEALLLFCE